MLNVSWGRERYTFCDRLTRRNFLQVGVLGVGGLTLPQMLRLQSARAEQPRRPPKAVIMVYLYGGPPHIDMYDMKPDAPEEYRGEFKPIRTNVPGTDICELLPLQAKLADKFTILRGVKFSDGDHSPYAVLTGWSSLNRFRRPTFGAVVSRLQGSRAPGMPAYVSTYTGVQYKDPQTSAHLGPAHRPFMPQGPGLEDLGLSTSVKHLEDQKSLLKSLDTLRRDRDSRGEIAGVDAYTDQALDIIAGDRARQAFDITREPLRVQERYGKESSQYLLARRLVEAGVSVVTIGAHGDYDTHGYNFPRLRSHLPCLDRGFSALLTDLYERGLDKHVLVYVAGEFGRTPKITPGKKDKSEAGRQHWLEAGFTLFAGGGLRMGQVIGATDARAERRIDGKPYMDRDMLATIYHVLGIDPSQTLPDGNNRPIPLLENVRPVAELIG
jgi:hypothetical protein